MLYAVTKALLSGAIIAMASEVAKRSPALGAVILSLPLVSLLTFIWLWRDTADKEAHRHFSAVYVLVRLADAPNVSGVASAAKKRFWVLVCACKFMRPNRAPLFLGCVVPSKAGYCLLTA
jgi:hypothetical protein